MRLFDRAMIIISIIFTGTYLTTITENMVYQMVLLIMTLWLGSVFWFFDEGNILSRFTHEKRSTQ